MSLQHARSVAEKLVAAIPNVKPPIDVKAIAARLKVPVLSDNLGDDVSGVLLTKDGRATIYYNSKEGKANNRYRFTIAHELGHHCLQHEDQAGEHVHVNNGFRVMMRGSLAAEGVDQCEIEANQFAASLLMPVNLLREAVEQSGGLPLSEVRVEELAKKFEVSDQAMTIRLSHLGYF
jgi:Zn-dependent peptidase ImmA (M78 family)